MTLTAGTFVDSRAQRAPLPKFVDDPTKPQTDNAPHRLTARAACLRLARPDVNLVTWYRELPPGIEVELDGWGRRQVRTFNKVLPVRGSNLLAATVGIAEPWREWLTADIRKLVRRVAQIAETDQVRVSFGPVHDDKCRKFHVDQLRYRLVTTYVGPGTEWVPDAFVNREALHHPAEGPCDANPSIVRDLSAVQQAAQGDVVFMKINLHPSVRGAVHRSPAIEGTGHVRVILVVSAVVSK